ncbi:MAG: hypothetical protein BWY14_00968 [Parcubacteria group bacterium ADurb.Bin192]|nr:MAG: hypothetical protein BWY14_00968 [Parcubacteria group bacterium ADurb.Bin192]
MEGFVGRIGLLIDCHGTAFAKAVPRRDYTPRNDRTANKKKPDFSESSEFIRRPVRLAAGYLRRRPRPAKVAAPSAPKRANQTQGEVPSGVSAMGS